MRKINLSAILIYSIVYVFVSSQVASQPEPFDLTSVISGVKNGVSLISLLSNLPQFKWLQSTDMFQKSLVGSLEQILQDDRIRLKKTLNNSCTDQLYYWIVALKNQEPWALQGQLSFD